MEEHLRPPFRAYDGGDLYAFVSYAHADSTAVFPEFERLRTLGVNLWFDEGISPGNEWPDEVARALDSSSQFLFFVSPRAVASRNCRNEVHYALNTNKPFTAIYLEATALPPGLALRIGDLQAIMKYAMEAPMYEEKLQQAVRQFIEDLRARRLVVCLNCGKPFDPNKGGVCSYHPSSAVAVANTGPRYDYAEYYEYPCCKAKVFGEVSQEGVDLLPPRTPGCKVGHHVF